jgi:hypothetical protein
MPRPSATIATREGSPTEKRSNTIGVALDNPNMTAPLPSTRAARVDTVCLSISVSKVPFQRWLWVVSVAYGQARYDTRRARRAQSAQHVSSGPADHVEHDSNRRYEHNGKVGCIASKPEKRGPVSLEAYGSLYVNYCAAAFAPGPTGRCAGIVGSLYSQRKAVGCSVPVGPRWSPRFVRPSVPDAILGFHLPLVELTYLLCGT